MPKNPGIFPNFGAQARRGMLDSALLFFEDMIFDASGGYGQMLTTPVAFINRHTAPLYGLEPEDFGEDWTRRSLDPSKRAGLLTLPAMLAVHADASEGNPIFRGVSFQEQILCAPVPPPNGTVPPAAPRRWRPDPARARGLSHLP